MFAKSLAEIATEGAVMRVVLLELCTGSQRAGQRSLLLCDKGVTNWHNVLSPSTVAFHLN